jgi:hypothetical protein
VTAAPAVKPNETGMPKRLSDTQPAPTVVSEHLENNLRSRVDWRIEKANRITPTKAADRFTVSV